MLFYYTFCNRTISISFTSCFNFLFCSSWFILYICSFCTSSSTQKNLCHQTLVFVNVGMWPFCSPFRSSLWLGHTQDVATTRQPGILCGWCGRLEQSPTVHSFRTDIINFKTCSSYICSHVPTSPTVSRVRAVNIVRCHCSDPSHVTAPYKLSFYYNYHHFLPRENPWLAENYRNYKICLVVNPTLAGCHQ